MHSRRLKNLIKLSMTFWPHKIFEQQPDYRLKQAKIAVFKDLSESWSEVKTFPLELRQTLDKEFPLEIKAKTLPSKKDETLKTVITLEDDLKIETVLISHPGSRNTVCVSSQVGCPLGCTFCATGEMKFKRNLTTAEIVSQVLLFARYLKKRDKKITNVVFMGMGEPFLNYDNVLEAINILNDKDGFNLGARKFSISTIGVIPGIKKLTNEKIQVNLAISLHAPNDKLREEIIPANKQYSLTGILKEVDKYIEGTHRRVMFEYLMIRNVNDKDEHALELANLLKDRLCFVNLIAYNPTGAFQPSLPNQIKNFKRILKVNGITVVERFRFGQDIKAACGQLIRKDKKSLE